MDSNCMYQNHATSARQSMWAGVNFPSALWAFNNHSAPAQLSSGFTISHSCSAFAPHLKYISMFEISQFCS